MSCFMMIKYQVINLHYESVIQAIVLFTTYIPLNKMNLTTVLLLTVLAFSATAFEVSVFYCGFNDSYCGQSSTDDVNPGSSIVILAFAITKQDGSVTIDDENFPTDQFNTWKDSGKNVVISVGGQNGNWQNVFASSQNTDNFVQSLSHIINKYNLDGVDLDIEDYHTPPITVSNAIIQLKNEIGSKLLIVSPEDVGVFKATSVHDENVGDGTYWNYWVPIIRRADDYIDYYQPQAYNNWYGPDHGSFQYLRDVYENWRNLQITEGSSPPLLDFDGVSGDKLLIGIMASPSAGEQTFYYTPDTIVQFKDWIVSQKIPLKGFMLWDSHWDSLNGNAVSNACLD